jgi:hypothetical protein
MGFQQFLLLDLHDPWPGDHVRSVCTCVRYLVPLGGQRLSFDNTLHHIDRLL